MRAVIHRAATAANIEIWENTFTLDLLDARRRLPRGAGLERPARQDDGLGQADDPGHGRGGPTLPRDHQSRRGHRRRHGHCLSRRGRAARHGVHAVPSYGALHRRRQPQPHQRGRPRRGRLAGRSSWPPLHARLRSPRRVGPARRGEPGERKPDGEDAASRTSTST